MKVELLNITPDAEKLIEQAGRTCYKSKIGNPEIIKNWIKSGHESVIEHASATFRISGISRALTHQLVRHRLASFSQQSQRYVNASDFEYVTPESIKQDIDIYTHYNRLMREIGNFYSAMVSHGIKKEDARFILPNACCTEIVVTMNFRSLRNFFKLRLDSHAQWEIRELAEKMLNLISPDAKNVFYDFIEMEK